MLLSGNKRPGNVVYLVDSGRRLAGAPGPAVSSNGRVWKMALDQDDPTQVTSLSILINGDDRAVKALTGSTSRTTSSPPRAAS